MWNKLNFDSSQRLFSLEKIENPLHSLKDETSKKTITTQFKDTRFKADFSNILAKQHILDKFHSNLNSSDQDFLLENYNRIDVHELDKWLDFNKSRMSIFFK